MRVQRIVTAIRYLLFVTALVVAMFTFLSHTAHSHSATAPSCRVPLDILDSGLASGAIRLLPLAACWLRLLPRALRATAL